MRSVCTVPIRDVHSYLQTHCSFIVAPTITTAPLDVATYLGEDSTFNCSATGEPTPVIVWMFGGVSLSSGEKYLIMETETLMGVSSTLVVQSIMAEDEGYYTCRAENVHANATAQAFLQPLCE